jgi:hypothetical protein
VIVKASCGDEPCSARAEGKLTNVFPVGTSHEDKPGTKLKPASADLWPGKKRTTLKLKYTKKTRRQANEALDKGKNVQAKVTVRATDAAGIVATAKRPIKVVEHPRRLRPKTDTGRTHAIRNARAPRLSV